MNPIALFTTLAVIAALVMLRLKDRVLIRVLGISTVLVVSPAIALMTPVLNWRVVLGRSPTTAGYVLVVIAAAGAIFMLAGLLATALRTVVDGVRAVRKQKDSKATQ